MKLIKAQNQDLLIVPTRQSVEFFKIDEIKYIEADGCYSLIHFEGKKKFTLSHPIGIAEQLLSPLYFLRIHRSYLVNIFHIVRHDCCNDKLILSGGIELPISRVGKKYLKSMCS